MNVGKFSRDNNPLTSSGGASSPPNNAFTRKTATPQKHPSKQFLNNSSNGRGSVSPITVPPPQNVVKPRPEREGITSTRNAIVEKFHIAITTGNFEEVKRILEEGQIKINARDTSQNTPLHTAITADKFEIASYLLNEGVNPSLANEYGNTPLHIACSKSSASYIDLIISASNKPPSHSSNPLTSSMSSPTLSRSGFRTPPVSTSPLVSSPSSSVLPLYGTNSLTSIIPPLNSFLNKVNTKGNTALHLACFHGNLEAVKILLGRGADITTNAEGWTALHHAAAMGHSAIISALLPKFPLPSLDARDTLGRTAFLLAAANGHIEAVRVLAKSGTDTGAVCETGESALHLAVRHLATLQAPNPDLDLIEELLSMKVNVSGLTKNGNSPLHIACLYGASSIVELFLNTKNISPQEVNCLNNKLHTPLYLSVMRPAYHHYTLYQGSREKERLTIMKLLLNSGAHLEKRQKETGKGKSVLHTAAKNGFGEILNYLTTTVAPLAPSRRGGGGLSPPNRFSDNISKKEDVNPQVEAMLRTIDPGVRDNMGRTALHYAAMSGSEICVNVLMRPLGAKLSLPLSQDCEGATPLHLAALYGHTRICEILIRETEAPDLVFMPDALGNTPLHCAALGKNSDTLEAILMRGGVVASTNLKYQTAFHITSVPPPSRKLLSYADNSSWFSEAVRMCGLLLEYGADIHAEDERGWTPLDYALATPQAHIPPIPPAIFEDTPSTSSVLPQLNPSSPRHPYAHSHSHSRHPSNSDDDAVTCCVAQFLVERGASIHTRDALLDHALHRVAAGGCADCLRILLDKGEDVECVGAKERTPLHVAAAHGHATLVNILLEYGANAHSRSAAQLTPLHQAARHGSYTCAELLLAHGAAVDAMCARDWTPLHHACAMGHTDLIALLVDHGADVNNTDNMGRTPLHKATYYSHPECVMWLVERGAQTNAEDENGETPVHYAAIRGLSAALIFMSAVGADLARPTKKGSTPIHLAARHDNIDTAMFLIEKDPQTLAAVTQKGRSALHVAARHGRHQMMKLLLEHGADCNAVDINGNTPLHMACKGSSAAGVAHLLTPYTHRQGANPNSPNTHGITPLHLAALRAAPEVAALLIQHGADINSLDDMGRTPVVCAVQALNPSCAHELLELGCSTEGTDEDGRTLLHVAAQYNSVSVLTQLLDHPPRRFPLTLRDADDNTALHTAASAGALEAIHALVHRAEGDKKEFLELKNALGRTALHLAALYGHFTAADILLAQGADLEALDMSNNTPVHLCTAAGHDPSFFIQKGANIGAVADKGLSVIHTAAAGGSVRCVEKILELRPDDINALTEEGDTPLHLAVRYGHSRVVSALLSHNTEALDAPNAVGCAPLHFAALHGKVSVLTVLIESLANLNLQDCQGRRPLHFAAMSNQKECATILLRRGVNPAPPDLDGRTPLHLAAARGQKALVGLLLSQNGIDPNVLDNEEATPLAYAQANEHADCIDLLQIHAKPPASK